MSWCMENLLQRKLRNRFQYNFFCTNIIRLNFDHFFNPFWDIYNAIHFFACNINSYCIYVDCLDEQARGERGAHRGRTRQDGHTQGKSAYMTKSLQRDGVYEVCSPGFVIGIPFYHKTIVANSYGY